MAADSSSLDIYKTQLEQVEKALCASGGNDEGLIQLKSDLAELLHLAQHNEGGPEAHYNTKAEHGAVPASSTDSSEDKDISGTQPLSIDDEFERFQRELSELDEQGTAQSGCIVGGSDIPAPDKTGDSYSPITGDQFCSQLSEELSGMRCCVAKRAEWGPVEYHNAMVSSVQELTADGDLMLRVFYTHPTWQDMVPCQHYLDGLCRFSDDCKFSHGDIIPLSSLIPYRHPAFSQLTIESSVLAKSTSGIWLPATIVNNPTGNTVVVEFCASKEILELTPENVLPSISYDMSKGTPQNPVGLDSSDDEDSAFGTEPPQHVTTESKCLKCDPASLQTTSRLGAWEKHTTGIGSKLMAKMGYVVGQGLGARSDGLAEPVPYTLLPKGKSLDRIMEIKEEKASSGTQSKTKKRKATADVRTVATQGKSDSSPFAFLNKVLGGGGKRYRIEDLTTSKYFSNRTLESSISKASGSKKGSPGSGRQGFGVQLVKTEQEISRVQRRIETLNESLERNKHCDSTAATKVEQKLDSMRFYLAELQSKRGQITRHQQRTADDKKATVF